MEIKERKAYQSQVARKIVMDHLFLLRNPHSLTKLIYVQSVSDLLFISGWVSGLCVEGHRFCFWLGELSIVSMKF